MNQWTLFPPHDYNRIACKTGGGTNMMDLSAATWACDRLEGIALGFAQNRKGNTANHVMGAVKLALRWGASTEQLRERVKHVSDFAYQPDPQRMEDLAHIVENALQ